MLLDIETRIGEMLPEHGDSLKTYPREGSRIVKPKEKGGVPFDIPSHRAKQAKSISRHPDIVERVKAQARENEDIPTRTVRKPEKCFWILRHSWGSWR